MYRSRNRGGDGEGPVTRQPNPNDDATERQLRLLVGLVVVFGAIATCVAVWRSVATLRYSAAGVVTLCTVVALVTISSIAVVQVRVRANVHAISWTDMAILVALSVAPVPQVIICVGIGVAVGKAIGRVAPMKAAFNVAKAILVATATGLVLLAFDVVGPVRLSQFIWPLALACLAGTVVDELLFTAVMGLATRTSMVGRFRTDIDIRGASLVLRFGIAVLAIAILDLNVWLLVAVPPLVLSLHLWHAARLRSRAERKAWQQLAAATDALNAVDMEAVLHTATRSASELFSADYVEVEVWLDKHRRLVRGDGERILYDGSLDSAPPGYPAATSLPLEGYDGGPNIGVLRLRFRGQVTLNEREDYTLRTFASALCTAIRNASAYAELARLADQHAHDAAHDPLTGLPNRRRLMDEGTTQLDRRASRGGIALMLIDLNHFKEVNDTLGHSAGDRVLIEIAQRLRAAAGPDALVARLGGDEFAVFFSNLPAPALATHRAETILAPIHEPIDLDGMRISVEASAGIAAAAASGGMGELLRRADVAMYQAKRAGQRTAVYTRSKDTADVGQLSLGGDLARAVAEHQFTVNFQPIVNLASGAAIAAEALARWHHPDRGNLDPRRFLHAVERSGQLAAFAEAVLDQALVAACGWADAGFGLPVAVNVSPRSLLDRTFPAMVLDRLETHGLPPERLILELTETLTISQLEVVDQVLGELRDAGVRLALDDFGTGYSSLSVLSRIPVHELKIDRAFVSSMTTSTEAAAVVRSTLDLGRSLDLMVVAEGVESESERQRLWELGCTAGQGHLFARPLPAGRLLAALQRGSGGRPGTLAPQLHEEGAVIRLPAQRRTVSRTTDERRAR
jgi:diguanylate cyclase (GGDEF)-like protein